MQWFQKIWYVYAQATKNVFVSHLLSHPIKTSGWKLSALKTFQMKISRRNKFHIKTSCRLGLSSTQVSLLLMLITEPWLKNSNLFLSHILQKRIPGPPKLGQKLSRTFLLNVFRKNWRFLKFVWGPFLDGLYILCSWIKTSSDLFLNRIVLKFSRCTNWNTASISSSL